MTELWPHLPKVVAEGMHDRLIVGDVPQPTFTHADQTWAPIGPRVAEKKIKSFADALTALAGEYGYPLTSSQNIAFDRAAAGLMRNHLDLTWAEAGNRDLWSFVSLVVLPHVTMWRFGVENRERWVASDLTRHTWARLWWQALVFAGNEDVLAALSESDLNQLLERRSIGGDPRLVVTLAKAIIATPPTFARREVIRHVTPRLRRYLAFVDARALNENQLEEMCRVLCGQTLAALGSGSDSPAR